MKNIKELDLSNKRVMIRVDLNVPLDDQGNVTDDTRILGVLPTLRYALEQNAKVILCSHCGRPKGQRQEKFSMAPAAKRLAQLLDIEVPLAPDCIGPEAQTCVDKIQPGGIILLENLRFHEAETKNDPEFSRQLADLADVYINDAFAVSHRAHASVEGITHYVEECAAGLLLQKEMDYFNRSVSNAAHPLVAILGGAKVSSKLGAIRNMLERVDKMIIGGAMANTFLKSQGYKTGSSLVEEDLLGTAKELISLAQEKGVKFYLPVDCIVADKFAPDATIKKVTIQEVPENWMCLDIGPATSIMFDEALYDAKTIVWNGPMGAFEMDAYSRGSHAMVQSLTAAHAMTVVGGGDTNAVVNQAGAGQDVSYMSTGGGAFLMLMEGKSLPGVTALEKKL